MLTEVVAIHRGKKLALLSTDELVRLELYKDAAVAGPDKQGKWYSIDLAQFKEVFVT